MEALISTIDSNLDIPINHFIIADFAGFAEIVEIVGGVPINFPYPTRDIPSAFLLDAGCWSLNGSESLGYVRARNIEELIDGEWVRLRAVSPDLARIERQQEFLVLALEQVLDVGRSDLSRIGDFIDASTQAVQLDEELTPGDMLDLASAFADYDTEALAVSTLPVAAQFAEDGRYVGEALVTEQARDLLAIFQGNADGVRPDQVSLDVASTSDSHADQLEERGFITIQLDEEVAGQTTIQFDPKSRNEALLVVRYLEGVPKLAPGFGSKLRLTVGADFAGVRQFPRPVGDIAPGLDQSIRLLTGATTTTVVTPVTSETSSTNVVNDDDPDLASTLVPDSADVPIGPATSDETSPTIVIRGRPPDGASCVPTGG